jgi:ParB family transcriptional regulator, chromosome partitioning protein
MSIWDNAWFTLMDPAELLVDQNSRTIEDIKAEDPVLCASIEEHGVLVPVIANPAGIVGVDKVRVRDGHKRTLAARLAVAKHPKVPVLVTECTDPRLWVRLRDQWIANEIRTGFNTGDKAQILEQMALDGLSDEDIATQLSLPQQTVKAGRRVHASARASEALARYPQLTLEQLAAFTEFEDDPDASERLNEVLDEEPDQFDHVVSELVLTREALAARDARAAELRAEGVTVLDDEQAREALKLSRLRVSATDNTLLTKDAHASCPGHAVRVTRGYGGDDPQVEFVCYQWVQHGHRDAWAASGSRPRKGKRTWAELQEGRRVRANNDKWRAAIPVRRKFIKDLLAAKDLPKQAHQRLIIAKAESDVDETRASKEFAATLLGLKKARNGRAHPIAAKAKRATADQAVRLEIAMRLAAFEIRYDLKHTVNTWRSPNTDDQAYFALLKDWGYPANKAGQLVLDPNADAKDWPHLQTAGAAPAASPDGSPADPDDTTDDLDEGTAPDHESDGEIDAETGAEFEPGPGDGEDEFDEVELAAA